MSDIRKMIDDCDRWHREANMKAIRSAGWRQRIELMFAAWWSYIGNWGREIERDEQRGKDDKYHDEY